MKLLVVEDDAVLGKALKKGLSEAGNECDWVRDGRKGLACASSQQYDAVVLDLLLPDLAGIDVLRSLRGEGIRLPVLVLTALSSIDDRVAGLKSGADDYLIKPF